jgi:para-nitrobenzyl esterase
MTIVNTPLGDVRGVAKDGYERYTGIRYAEPPVGPRRFRAPEPAGGWDGVYDATEYGPPAPQPPQLVNFTGERIRQWSED